MTSSDFSSFGDLLRAFRKREHLTQQQLADRVGMHRHAISRWEQGYVLPASKTLILELAACLRLNDQETRQLLEESLTAVASHWWVPYHRNAFFCGRKALLQQLFTALSANHSSSVRRSCSLSGLAGIGKTQIALEYAHLHALDYSAVFWLSAEASGLLTSCFSAIARTLKLPLASQGRQEDVIDAVLEWLTTHRNWLLIVDDVQDIASLIPFLPSSQTGSLLFTTRLPTLGTFAHSITVPPLSLQDSRHLLLHRAGFSSLEQPAPILPAQEEEAAQALVVALGGLPLALEQTAAYIEASRCHLTEMLQLFRDDPVQMLYAHPASVLYPCSVAATFALSFERLCHNHPVAADLLLLCCFLAPNEIPEALLIKGMSYLPGDLQTALAEPFHRNTIFTELLAHALLQRHMPTQTLSLHPLVQIVLRATLTEQAQQRRIDVLLRMLDHLFIIEPGHLQVEQWDWYEQLLPHALSLFQIADQLHVVSARLMAVLSKVAAYLWQRARFVQAKHYYLRVFAIQERGLGAAYPALLPILTGIDQGYWQAIQELDQCGSSCSLE